jgi:hypothetical protein
MFRLNLPEAELPRSGPNLLELYGAGRPQEDQRTQTYWIKGTFSGKNLCEIIALNYSLGPN